jgi:two-component system NarL family sensor kinase
MDIEEETYDITPIQFPYSITLPSQDFHKYCKDKILPSNIYGCDIEKDTIKFGVASLMLTTNEYNENIIRCNSLIENASAHINKNIFSVISNKELVAKEALVQELVKQRAQIIESDEETRQLVSKYLHNNLQSGLVVINHQLGVAIKELPEAARGRFQSILKELEMMRKVEIREASRALSPNLDVLSLETLVEPLIDVYKAAMKVTVKSQEIEYSSVKHIGLAIYRIVEQVLLNATVHGGAQNATVDFIVEDSSVRLTISNDGKPVDVDAIAFGIGTAIIDTWVSSLEGKWGIDLNTEGNTSFTCKLAI